MQRHHSMNERVKEGNVDLVFVGDSITQGWEGSGRKVWEKYYGKRNAVNLGIGGDRTQHVIWRLDNGNLEGITPKAAVIMIGTNNSGTNSPEEIADGVTAIVRQLQEKTPETEILLLATFPRGAEPSDKKRQVNEKSNAIVAVNGATRFGPSRSNRLWQTFWQNNVDASMVRQSAHDGQQPLPCKRRSHEKAP